MSLSMTLRRMARRPYRALRGLVDRTVFAYRYHRRPDRLRALPTQRAAGTRADDGALIDRIIAAYRRSAHDAEAAGDTMWRAFFQERHQDIHAALVNGPRSRVEEILRNPGTSDLCYGFDALASSLLAAPRRDDREAPAMAVDGLFAFAESVGVLSLDNPESYGLRAKAIPTVDAVLALLDRALGVTLPLPNPFPGEIGAVTSRGVLSYRVPQAMYQAWRVRSLTGHLSAPRILELGGGMGRTAFYAHVLGVTDYTIVDLPITAVAQGYFLGRTLGPDRVTLDGEPRLAGAIALQSPRAFHGDTAEYDLVLNADGLTEMDQTVAEAYWAAFTRRAPRVLSINHEMNSFSVNDLIRRTAPLPTVHRTRAWMRRGYVEELVAFNGEQPPVV